MNVTCPHPSQTHASANAQTHASANACSDGCPAGTHDCVICKLARVERHRSAAPNANTGTAPLKNTGLHHATPRHTALHTALHTTPHLTSPHLTSPPHTTPHHTTPHHTTRISPATLHAASATRPNQAPRPLSSLQLQLFSLLVYTLLYFLALPCLPIRCCSATQDALLHDQGHITVVNRSVHVYCLTTSARLEAPRPAMPQIIECGRLDRNAAHVYATTGKWSSGKWTRLSPLGGQSRNEGTLIPTLELLPSHPLFESAVYQGNGRRKYLKRPGFQREKVLIQPFRHLPSTHSLEITSNAQANNTPKRLSDLISNASPDRAKYGPGANLERCERQPSDGEKHQQENKPGKPQRM
eukprot:3142030-Rhodomonas_salina.4